MITLSVIDPTRFGIEVWIPYLWSKLVNRPGCRVEGPAGVVGGGFPTPQREDRARAHFNYPGSSPRLSAFIQWLFRRL